MTEPMDFKAAFASLSAGGPGEMTARSGGVNVRLVRVAGGKAGRWDSHEATAEIAVVWSGDFTIEFRDRTVSLAAGQCCIVPAGTEHRGTSKDGAEVILFQA